jgi:hypothetical protein
VPILLSIEKVVAFVVFHDNVEDDPGRIAVGFAESVQVGADGGGGVVIVTVAVQVTEPPGPVAVPVYVVFAVGETDFVPEATGVEVPTPLSMKKVVAFVVFHDNVEDEPDGIAVGFAESVHVGAAGGVATVTIAEHVTSAPVVPETVNV